jgi:hypothetical protein
MPAARMGVEEGRARREEEDMGSKRWVVVLCVSAAICGQATGCRKGGRGNQAPESNSMYTLTISTTNPTKGVMMVVTPNDINGTGNGVSLFERTYEAGTTVTITAPATVGQNKFDSWDGCTLAITETCTVNMSADTIVNAVYEVPPS